MTVSIVLDWGQIAWAVGGIITTLSLVAGILYRAVRWMMAQLQQRDEQQREERKTEIQQAIREELTPLRTDVDQLAVQVEHMDDQLAAHLDGYEPAPLRRRPRTA